MKVAGSITANYTEANGIVTFTGGHIPTAGQAISVGQCDWFARVRFEQDYNPIAFPVSLNNTRPVASAGPFVLVERFR